MIQENAKMTLVAPRTIIITPIQGKRPISRACLSMTMGMAMTTPNSSFSDSDDSSTLETTGPRKRKRLTHLTPEERMLRRKLKNRVAAQTARDRKKMRMQDLEEAVAELEAENRRLQMENLSLKTKSGSLSQENVVLKEKLGQKDDHCGSPQTEKCDPPESAAGKGSHPLSSSFTVPGIYPNNESDLLGFLQQIVEDSTPDDKAEHTGLSPASDLSSREERPKDDVVGPTTAELESLKELIQFDHEYYKSESPLVISQQGVKPLRKICPKIVDAKESHSKMVSIVSPSDDVGKQSYTTVTVLVTPSENTNETISMDTTTSLDSFSLTETDLADYFENNLESLMDLNSLLEESQVEDSDNVVSVHSEDTFTYDTMEVNTETAKSESVIDSTKVNSINLDSDIFELDICSPLPPSPIQSLVDTEINARKAISDSAYGSDISDIGSPKSDISLFGEQDGLWEESFTELFPSLA